MVRKPFLLDVTLEFLAAPPGIAQPPLGQPLLRTLPGAVSLLRGGERSGRTAGASDVVVERLVARDPVSTDPSPAEAHGRPSSLIICHSVVTQTV